MLSSLWNPGQSGEDRSCFRHVSRLSSFIARSFGSVSAPCQPWEVPWGAGRCIGIVSPWQLHGCRTEIVHSWIFSGSRTETFLRSISEHNRAGSSKCQLCRWMMFDAILRLPLCSSIRALLRKQFCSSWACMVLRFCGQGPFSPHLSSIIYHVNIMKRKPYLIGCKRYPVPADGNMLFRVDDVDVLFNVIPNFGTWPLPR